MIDHAGPVQGPVGNGESTDDTTPTLVGRGEPGDTIVVIDNGTPIGETKVDEEGNWSFTPDTPLAEGEHEFTVVERDPAGNESRPSEPHVVIIDTTPPGTPEIGEVIDDAGPVKGPVGNGESTDDTTPTLVGRGEPGDTIVVIDNGTPIGETKVDEEGNWSFTPDTPLAEGEHEFTVVERDPAGNESRPSEPHVVIIDTTPPGTPEIGEVIDDAGPVQGPVGNGESTDDTTPTLVGRGEPGDTIVVIDNGTPIGETKVDEEGNWSFTPDTPLAEGEHEFTVVERDPAGNESRPSEPHVVIIDTTPPGTPEIGEVIDDAGPVQGPVGNGESTDDTTPTLVGRGEPGDTIIVIDNGTPIGETKVDEEGNWSFTPDTPLAEGEHEFTVVERDPAGNESRPSEPHVVIIDTTPPGTPEIGEVIDDAGPVQGPVGNGESTDDTTPTLVGRGEPGDTIIVIDNGTPIGETKVDEEGSWSFTPDTPLAEGEHEFTVVERDPAGNESRPSEPHVVIIDTTPPGTPEIGEVIDDAGPVQGPVGNGESTDDTTPTLVGRGEPGDTIIVIDNGTPIGETKVDEEGNWSFTPDTPLAEGEHEFTVVERDPAGNESRPSEPHVVIIDTAVPLILKAPEVPEMADGVIDSAEASDGTWVIIPSYAGMAVGDTITLEWNGKTYEHVVSMVDEITGKIKLNIPVDDLIGQDAEFDISYTVTDAAGHISSPSPTTHVRIYTMGPDTPEIGEVIDDVGPIQGPVGNGESTDDTTPTLVGRGEPGDTIVVIDNGTPIGETKVDEEGNWSFTPDTPLAEGEHEFTVVERDPAGNESRPSEPHVVVVDTTPPSAEATITMMGKDSVGDIRFAWQHYLTNDGSAGRLIMGSLTAQLAAGEKVQVSVDGGKTWHDALIDNLGNWVFQDNTAHDADWTIQARVVDTAGNSSNVSSQNVTLDTTAPDAPISTRVVNGGTAVYVELPASAKVGDFVSLAVGNARYAYRLDEGAISRGGLVCGVSDEEGEFIRSNGAYGVALVDSAGNASSYTSEVINGGGHNEVVPGGLSYHGTSANDIFTLSGDFLGAVYGNGGIDTLKLKGADQTLDLSRLRSEGTLSSVEVFDITGTGKNTLKLSLGDVLELGGKDLFVADGRTQVMVKGDAGDKVELSDLLPDGGDVGDWVRQSGTTTVGGVSYDVFYHTALNAELLVQHGVDTTLSNH
ncbi:putative hemagglutinin/hemolysin-related protein [Paraburkholderia atlantica]|uniref:Hemagglutinin/hemolysin-related protein n=1 Tax=Paraburkholderia atlantica TaxID=2654982 RepID=D5WBV3_PARAM|nr:putative hemagglutinin/hemolysin-related protein [Paraburkholderia atlantica]